jgi:hypothetical protein
VEYDNEMLTKTGSNFLLPKTTKGWEIQVSFRDESTAWLPMNEVWMSNPIELAEYAAMSICMVGPPCTLYTSQDDFQSQDKILANNKKVWD